VRGANERNSRTKSSACNLEMLGASEPGCDEPTVSNACRSPKNDIDKFACDDQKMADLQKGAWETTKDILKTTVGALIGRLP
jgi:hypothetical protein